MVSKSKIENILTEAYNHNSFEYLGLCDGGNDGGQVVYVQVTRKVAPKRNRTTIKKIVKQEIQRAGAHYNLVRLFACNFIGSRKAPEYKMIIGINKNGAWAGDKIEIIVRGTNAHRLSWLFSNQYKKDKLAKSVGKKEYTKIKQARERGKR